MSELTSADWAEYYQAMVSRPLHEHYKNLDPHLPNGGEALELGCGVGQGVVHLLEKGFSVTAVDAEEEALKHLRNRLPKGAPVRIIHSKFEDLMWSRDEVSTLNAQHSTLSAYDVVVAHFSLFFLPPDAYKKVWKNVVASIRPGGLLSAQFLGVRDEWVARGYTVQSREELDEMLKPFEVLFLDEVERDGETALKTPKHWHVFHVVARKL